MNAGDGMRTLKFELPFCQRCCLSSVLSNAENCRLFLVGILEKFLRLLPRFLVEEGRQRRPPFSTVGRSCSPVVRRRCATGERQLVSAISFIYSFPMTRGVAPATKPSFFCLQGPPCFLSFSVTTTASLYTSIALESVGDGTTISVISCCRRDNLDRVVGELSEPSPW